MSLLRLQLSRRPSALPRGLPDAEGVLAHLENVGKLLEEVLAIADLTRLEIHGPETELAKLRGPLAGFNPAFFVLEYGFRR